MRFTSLVSIAAIVAVAGAPGSLAKWRDISADVEKGLTQIEVSCPSHASVITLLMASHSHRTVSSVCVMLSAPSCRVASESSMRHNSRRLSLT